MKFKKCLLAHTALDSGSTAADIWWVCDRWIAPLPASSDLLIALGRTGNSSLERLDDFLNQALAAPTATIDIDWATVFIMLARKGYPDLQQLYRRILSKIPDLPASFYAQIAEAAAQRSPALLKEMVANFLKLSDASVEANAMVSFHQSVKRACLTEQTAQLEERFPQLVRGEEKVETGGVDPDEEFEAGESADEVVDAEDRESTHQNVSNEASLPPEVEARSKELWQRFEGFKNPSSEQMDEHLTNLLALPPEATDWAELLREFSRLNHADLPQVFRRIALAVPHVKTNGMAWFYWAAAEAFIPKARSEMLPEIAAGFQKLDVKSYDPDALSHLLDYLLSHGYETDALALAEHFLPIQREDPNLLGWVVPDLVYLIFELRLGQQFRTVPEGANVDAVAQQLRCDIEKEITGDAFRLGAEICCQHTPETPWTRSYFELVIRAHHGNTAAQRASLR